MLTLTKRAVVFVFGVLLIALGLGVLGLVWEFVGLRDFSVGSLGLIVDFSELSAQDRLVWTIYAGVSLATGVGAVILALRQKRPPRSFEIQRTTHPSGVGDLRVTLRKRGLMALMAFLAESIEGVGEATPAVQLSEDGWDIGMVLYLDTGAVIPEVVDRTRALLRSKIETQTGIQVDQLTIEVELLRKPRQKRVA